VSAVERDEPGRLRRLLPRAHVAFLGRFAAPTEVQRRGVPPILDGGDVLLCAPTASGKTEAFAAPTIERLLGDDRAPLSWIAVSPTRALANDLKRRLEAPMDTCRVAFGRHTGEHKERSGGSWPEAVVVTPEALDSLLARRSRLLRGVRAIVLDEIHVLDGTPRGDQLRVLLERLEQAAELRPQRIAASATVGDPEGLAARYLDGATVVDATGHRSIRATPFPGVGVAALAEHLTKLASAGARKVLAFCNRRRDVDRLAAELARRTPFAERVFAHHGSLSRAARERTERQFLDAPAAVAFATLTLELRIDIGTVDYVLLVEPPPSVSSLLQRIGRGGRRGESTRVGYAFADAAQKLLFEVMLRAGKRRELCEAPYVLRPGVLVQQALVLAGGSGHVTAAQLERVVPGAIRGELPRGFGEDVLRSMEGAELLEPSRGGRHVLSGTAERRYDLGKLHSNFTRPPGLSIIHRLTGDVLGELDPHQLASGNMQLGGRSWRAAREVEGRLLVDQTAEGESAGYAASDSPCTSLALARAVARELGAGEAEWLQGRVGSAIVLLHGLGTLGGLVLAAHLARELGSGAVSSPTAFTLKLARELKAVPLLTDGDLRHFAKRHEARLARALGMGPHHHQLPDSLRVGAIERALEAEQLVERIAGATVRTVEPEGEGALVWELL